MRPKDLDAVELSIFNGIGGCWGCPSLTKVCQMIMPDCALPKRLMVLALAADETTLQMVLHIVCMGPFSQGAKALRSVLAGWSLR